MMVFDVPLICFYAGLFVGSVSASLVLVLLYIFTKRGEKP